MKKRSCKKDDSLKPSGKEHQQEATGVLQMTGASERLGTSWRSLSKVRPLQ